MNPQVVQILVGQMANFTYVVGGDNGDDAVVIDPSWDLEKVFSVLKKNGWKAKYVINTHTHFDHVLGNEQVASVTGARIIQHENSKLEKDIPVKEGQSIEVGNFKLKVLHTPGHSEDSICLLIDNNSVFTGDTLFVGTCGRTDLPGSDPAKMYQSLHERLAKLDGNLIVYPGHNYGSTPASTIGQEIRTNFVLQPRSKQDFLDIMGASD